MGCEPKDQQMQANGSIEFINCGQDPIFFQYLGLADNVLLSHKLRRLIGPFVDQIDVVHFTIASASLFFDCGFITTAWFPLSTIDTIKLHPCLWKFPKSILGIFALLEYGWMEHISFRKARKIVCLVEETFKKMNEIYPGKAVWIPPPIKVGQGRKEVGESSTPIILFVSREIDHPRKNLKTILFALKLLARRGVTRFRFVIVGGKGHSLMPLISELRSTGIDITLDGYMPRSSLLRFYDRADVFVSPNLYEELGYATLEALSAGLPIVASDILPFRDLVENGVNGYRVPPLDYNAFATALQELIEHQDLRREMSKASLRIAEKRFSYEVVGEKLVNLYKEILN
jgi:glycosyltransferase involved in cell wall biosynthesis